MRVVSPTASVQSLSMDALRTSTMMDFTTLACCDGTAEVLVDWRLQEGSTSSRQIRHLGLHCLMAPA